MKYQRTSIIILALALTTPVIAGGPCMIGCPDLVVDTTTGKCLVMNKSQNEHYTVHGQPLGQNQVAVFTKKQCQQGLQLKNSNGKKYNLKLYQNNDYQIFHNNMPVKY